LLSQGNRIIGVWKKTDRGGHDRGGIEQEGRDGKKRMAGGGFLTVRNAKDVRSWGGATNEYRGMPEL